MRTLKELLAENIKTKRYVLRLTQSELAEKADLSLIAVQRAESGKLWPVYSTIEALAKALELEPQELFKGPSKPTPTIAELSKIIERLELENKQRVPSDIAPHMTDELWDMIRGILEEAGKLPRKERLRR